MTLTLCCLLVLCPPLSNQPLLQPQAPTYPVSTRLAPPFPGRCLPLITNQVPPTIGTPLPQQVPHTAKSWIPSAWGPSSVQQAGYPGSARPPPLRCLPRARAGSRPHGGHHPRSGQVTQAAHDTVRAAGSGAGAALDVGGGAAGDAAIGIRGTTGCTGVKRGNKVREKMDRQRSRSGWRLKSEEAQ